MMPVQWQPRAKLNWSPVGRLSKQNYYTTRPVVDVDYSEYWGEKLDPDGKVRKRMSATERLCYLENVGEERAFVEALRCGSILDFGCGPGWFLDVLRPAWRTVGVEVAEDALHELARRGIEAYTSLSQVGNSAFDVVFCHHVIEHLEDPITAIGDLRDKLVEGGWLIIGTPDFESPCAKRFGSNYRMLHDPTHCSLFTLESMHRFLRDHGFTIRDVRFPFPERFATQDTWDRWHDTSKVSPPWPGNWMTFYCQR